MWFYIFSIILSVSLWSFKHILIWLVMLSSYMANVMMPRCQEHRTPQGKRKRIWEIFSFAGFVRVYKERCCQLLCFRCVSLSIKRERGRGRCLSTSKTLKSCAFLFRPCLALAPNSSIAQSHCTHNGFIRQLRIKDHAFFFFFS